MIAEAAAQDISPLPLADHRESLATLYHGTSTRHFANIRKHGLQPSFLDGDGLDEGILKRGTIFTPGLLPYRGPSVCVTSSITRATCFAACVADFHEEQYGGLVLPVVLKLLVPTNVLVERFVLDELCEQPLASRQDYRTEASIPFEMIASVIMPSEEDVRRAFRQARHDGEE